MDVRERRVATASGTSGALFVLFLVAYAFRFALVLQLSGTPFFGALAGEALFLEHWARAIAAGNWLGLERAYPAPPFTMYYLAAIYALFGRNMVAVRIVGCLIDAFNCVLLYAVGKKMFGHLPGLASAALWAVYLPALFYEAVMPGTSALVALLLCALNALISAASDERRLRAWFFAGACLALAALGRPHLVAILPVSGLWSLYSLRRRRPRLRAAAAVALLGAGFLVVAVLPCARNLVITGEPGFSVNYGPGFYVGNYPDDPAGIIPRVRGSLVGGDVEEYTAFASALAGRALTPREASAFWFRRTLDHIRSQPRAFLERLAQKARDYVGNYEIPDDWDYRYLADRFSVLRMPAARFGLVLALGVGGTLAALSAPGPDVRRTGWLLAGLSATYTGAVLSMFYVSRYRHFVAPILVLGAGYLATALPAAWRDRRLARLAGLSLLSVLVFLQGLVRPNPLDHDRAFASCLVLEGVLREQHGDFEGALSCYKRSAEMSGHSPRPFVYVADLLLSRGDPRGAIEWYYRAQAAGPLSAHELCNMARSLAMVGRQEEAVEVAHRAAALDPTKDEPQRLLAELETSDIHAATAQGP
ncbi:MAG: glycosyltransferase family 39 protein [Bacillota bacterium]